MKPLTYKLTMAVVFAGLLYADQSFARELKAETEVNSFLKKAEQQLLDANVKFARGHYIWDTYKTRDTAQLLGEVFLKRNDTYVKLAAEANKFPPNELSDVERRKLLLLKSASTWNTPIDKEKRLEKRKLQQSLMQLITSKSHCESQDNCLAIGDINELMKSSKDADELKRLWSKGHELAQPILPHYTALSTLIDENAKELGFSNSLDLWSAPYQGTKQPIIREMDRVWQQVEPLYSALKCHVSDKLGDVYGASQIPENQAIPAHLFGNLSASDFTPFVDLVTPFKDQVSADTLLTEQIQQRNLDALAIVKQAESFYTSIGFEALPESFYQYSQFTKPRDREVECYPHGWVMDYKDDIRLRMCIEPNANNFIEVHKQMSYLLDARAHNSKPLLFNQQPNDAFNQALKEAMALSITPSYLKKANLAVTGDTELNDLMQLALEKVSALPFDLAFAHWQEKTANGDKNRNDNAYWWSLRERYQGITAPIHRDDEAFDVGIQSDVTAFNSTGITNFLATILQFQFHESLCEAAGNNKPLHHCSIYNSKKAGKKLNSTFELGSSQPWPKALAKISGDHQLDGMAIVNYFAPLQKYLDEQNKGLSCVI